MLASVCVSRSALLSHGRTLCAGRATLRDIGMEPLESPTWSFCVVRACGHLLSFVVVEQRTGEVVLPYAALFEPAKITTGLARL